MNKIGWNIYKSIAWEIWCDYCKKDQQKNKRKPIFDEIIYNIWFEYGFSSENNIYISDTINLLPKHKLLILISELKSLHNKLK